MKSAGSEAGKPKDKININIFLSQDIPDDGFSDNESAPQNNSVSTCITFISCKILITERCDVVSLIIEIKVLI
jgi:hypothetical protein